MASAGCAVGGDFESLRGLGGWIVEAGKSTEIRDIFFNRATKGVSATNKFDAALGAPYFRNRIVLFEVPSGHIYLLGSRSAQDASKAPAVEAAPPSTSRERTTP